MFRLRRGPISPPPPKKIAIVKDVRNGCKYQNYKNLYDKCCRDAIFFLTAAAKRRSDSRWRRPKRELS